MHRYIHTHTTQETFELSHLANGKPPESFMNFGGPNCEALASYGFGKESCCQSTIQNPEIKRRTKKTSLRNKILVVLMTLPPT